MLTTILSWFVGLGLIAVFILFILVLVQSRSSKGKKVYKSTKAMTKNGGKYK